MIKNYFKIALRNLWKHKVFSFINITGLSIGITACFFIFMYVGFELSYDNFHTKADRIYRLVTDIKTPTETINTGITAWPFAPNIKADFPEVESFVRISGGSFLVRKGDVKFQEEHSIFADSTFFKVFDFKLLKGDPRTALTAPATIVFTEKAAKKYFGNKNPMGQTVLVTGDAIPAVITGIMKDIPENSQIKADMLISMTSLTQRFNKEIDNSWGNFGATSYLLLKPNTNPKALEAKFPAFLERRNGKEERDHKMSYKFFLEPLKSVYLHSTRGGQESGSITNVYIFGIVAVFILLIACFNFVNLTTARSVERAKEVGIRKVVGAEKSQLASQFIGESVVLCLIAFVLTVILSVLLLPMFNQLAGKTVSPGIFSNWYYVVILLGTAVLIGLVAGIYPALVLSSFKPVSVLKGRFSSGTKGNLLRKTLVVSQFTISIFLIIGTIIVYKQMSFMQNRDLGFAKDQMLILDTNGDPGANAFKEAIASIPGVQSTANSSSVPGGGNPGAYSEIENTKGDLQIANLDLYFVDWDYINQFKIKMVAGRPFSREFGTDTAQAMLLNEAAVKMFGYTSPQQAIGKRFKQWGREGKIVGVMKDFHFRSLQEVIKPLSMRIELKNLGLISAKISSNNLSATIAAIQNKWKMLIPGRPFSYYFLDEFFDRQYRSEQRFGKLFFNFAVLAIFISCLGLLGLASYSTLQRTREIGIRKVMGATVPGIVNLLSKDFLTLVGISFLIASPVAGLFMHYYWLKSFAYRVDMSWWIFALAGLLAVVIALATISFQAIRAAMANPVKSLKSE
ncbi:putative ABC transport system permease protein [Mucilaginibacter pineti]|uniref:Putative ABC transport system permease protein n=1 Tax=Mucilaginibacter pineti TaxID=1391627 RepID=A0A1G6SYC6_9SPHI|nr:ABC transporter permease [Mucilaginibacter pineti]SDD21624.1 putative ABC transport system permease protein [Mucilaginibacter pineti]